jgi:hypothetical protein
VHQAYRFGQAFTPQGNLPEGRVEVQQIDVEIRIVDRDAVLPTDKCESLPQLEQDFRYFGPKSHSPRPIRFEAVMRTWG